MTNIVEFDAEEAALTPIRKHEGDSGWDLMAAEDCNIDARSRSTIRTGVRSTLKEG